MKLGTVVRFNAGRAKKSGTVVDMSSETITIEADGKKYRRRPASVVADAVAPAPVRKTRAPIPRRDAPVPHSCPRGHSGTTRAGEKVVHNYSSPKINAQNRRHYFRCRVCLLQWTEVRTIEVHDVVATLTKKGGE
tara:strand:- start:318 stop:722 length:405 start_codon:yes stop_codon:yes gene_type:complete